MSEESKWFYAVNHKTNITGIIYIFRGKKVYSSNVNKTNSSFQIKPINVLLEFQEKINFSYSCSDSNNNCLNLFIVENTWNPFAHSTTNHFSLEFILSRTTGVIHCGRLKAATNSLQVLTLRWSLISLPLNLGWPHWLFTVNKIQQKWPGIPKVIRSFEAFTQSFYTLWEPWSTMSNVRVPHIHAGDSVFCDSMFCLMSRWAQPLAIPTKVALTEWNHLGPHRPVRWILQVISINTTWIELSPTWILDPQNHET